MPSKKRSLLRSLARGAYRALRRRSFAGARAADAGAVVFAGDSITDDWRGLAEAFPGLKLANRGIAGDLSGELAARFEADVLSCRPGAVVLLIGTNDLAAGVPPRRVAAAIRLMAGRVLRRGAPVILCLVPPRSKAPDTLAGEIRGLNGLIRGLEDRRAGILVCDTFSPLAHADGSCREDCFKDGLHPNTEGYRRLAEALNSVLRRLSPLPSR